MAKAKAGRSKELQVATRDYTLNMHKRLQGIAFKKRATRAVRVCARFAASEMHTEVSISMSNLLSRSSNLILTNFISFRMWEWTLNWTDIFGQGDAETFQDLLELESAEKRMKKRTPKDLSIAPSNFSKLNHSPASKPKTDDQSNSCFILYFWWINYINSKHGIWFI